MMRTLFAIFIGLFAFCSARAETVDFDKAKIGESPEGWTAGVTGDGKPKWTVEADPTSPSNPNVLKQSGYGEYPYCVKKDVSLKDGFVEVKFKPISGKEDQAGGVIWRFKDGDNYYIARANALEDNVTIYHTVAGIRRELNVADAEVGTNKWHTLRVDFKGTHATVSFDGKTVIQNDDDTFSDAGPVGVWTKEDSVTEFDDFQYGQSKEAEKQK
jgi:hypothetical protein